VDRDPLPFVDFERKVGDDRAVAIRLRDFLKLDGGTQRIDTPEYQRRVLAMEGSDVPWHRVIGANGRPAHHLEAEQLERLRAEGVRTTDGRVDMARYRWDGS
jgi:hypothetical protein